ncbi:hypothetical protein C5Y96_01310 [Blastopirellula marina]|uniref:GYF domain-containing protein n=1 Tax=Blastopirellula marina TaxID=124 RepID=A0A2S8G8K9_9BACT|nr:MULTISPECIES: DUF4339 domain-containing protein [Pirellulaceae]PQO40763.1 hypothetical protein C5Y96_01310 [Blastopirellula marina]RCS56073.1 DUF4339 domain-containing protein [Bremerella cremea]
MPSPSSSSTQSELRWYYAVDDAHVGPVSATKFWQLAEEGVIKADTLVWCTGYTDWVPAKTIDGLFRSRSGRSSDSSFSGGSPSSAQLSPTPMKPPPTEDITSEVDSMLLMQIAKSGILLGLLCIVFTRGCDQIDQARIDGLSAQRSISEQEFQQREASEIGPLQQKVEELQAKEFMTAEDKKQQQEAVEALRTAKVMMANEHKRMEAETWGPLRAEEARAGAEKLSVQMFRRIAGLLGTTLTLLGLGIALFYSPPDQQLGIWIVLGVLIAAAYLA